MERILSFFGTVRISPRVVRVIAACSVVITIVQVIRGARDLLQTDFFGYDTGAYLLRHGITKLYSVPAVHSAQVALSGVSLPAGQVNMSLLPPLPMWLLQPVSLLPLAVGFVVMALLMGGIVIAALHVIGRTVPTSTLGHATIVAAVFSLPASWGFALGQFDPLLLIGVAGTAAWSASSPFLAGLCGAALFLKPQLAWCLPLLFLLRGQWKALAGFCTGAVVWALSTVLIIGGAGSIEWVRSAFINYQVETTPMMGLPGFIRPFVGVGSPVTVIVSVAAMAFAVVVLVAGRSRVRHIDHVDAAALAILIPLIATFHVWSHDLILLALPVAVLARRSPGAAFAAVAALDIASLIDSTLPRPWAPCECLVLLASVPFLWFAFRTGRVAE